MEAFAHVKELPAVRIVVEHLHIVLKKEVNHIVIKSGSPAMVLLVLSIAKELGWMQVYFRKEVELTLRIIEEQFIISILVQGLDADLALVASMQT